MVGDVQRGRPLLQGVPSYKTVRRTVLEFTPCGAHVVIRISLSAESDKGSALDPQAFFTRKSLAKNLFVLWQGLGFYFTSAFYLFDFGLSKAGLKA